jgi:glycosyltransferase involved in cell wall biosynthesis
MENLKILHLQKGITSTGRAPLRLHNAFLEENIESQMLVMDYDENLTSGIQDTGRNSRLTSRADHYMQSFITHKINKKYGMYTYPVLGTNVSKIEMVKSADIIYLHWVQGGFMSLSSYRQIAELGKPIIFFMHDMWTITGGCHYSFTCEKYKSKCFACQMFPSKGIIDWVASEFKRKRKFYSDFKNLYFASPSKWLFECAKKSNLTKDKPIFYIPNVIDNRLFKPVGKKFSRHILNIKSDGKIIAFGANFILSAYKGWPELLKALKILGTEYSRESLTILIFGGGSNNKEIEKEIPFNVQFMGFLKDEYSTVLVYNAADVLVTPSLADNLPTTVLECESCGTPVVGFDVGGVPDMIKHKENGYLAKYRDPEDLAAGIRFCLESDIKGFLLPEFERKNLIDKHAQLMHDIVN